MNTAFLHVDSPEWLEVLAELPHDAFHRPDYLRFEADRMGGRAEAFVARDGADTLLVPYVVRSCADVDPRAGVDACDATSPSGYAGILMSTRTPAAGFTTAALAALCDGLRRRRVVSMFIRMHPILNRGMQDRFPRESVARFGDSVAIALDGDDPDVASGMTERHRRSLRRAVRSGCTAHFGPLDEVLDEFVCIYDETMDRVSAQPSYRFSHDYFRALAVRPDLHCCLVRREGRAVSGFVLFEYDGIVSPHLGGTLSDELRDSPYLFAYHQTAAWARARGNRWLHIGGGVSGASDSLFEFKAGMSPLRFQMFAVNLIADPDAYQALKQIREQAVGRPGALDRVKFFPIYRAPLFPQPDGAHFLPAPAVPAFADN